MLKTVNVNTRSWSFGKIWELRASQTINVEKWTNSRRQIVMVLRRWLRQYFGNGPGVWVCLGFFHFKDTDKATATHSQICSFTVMLGLQTKWRDLLVLPQQAGVCAPTCLLRVQWEGKCSQTRVCVSDGGTHIEMLLFEMWKTWSDKDKVTKMYVILLKCQAWGGKNETKQLVHSATTEIPPIACLRRQSKLSSAPSIWPLCTGWDIP